MPDWVRYFVLFFVTWTTLFVLLVGLGVLLNLGGTSRIVMLWVAGVILFFGISVTSGVFPWSIRL